MLTFRKFIRESKDGPVHELPTHSLKAFQSKTFPDKVKEYRDKIKKGEHIEPVKVSIEGMKPGNFDILDGHHRWEAHKAEGKKTIKAHVYDSLAGDPVSTHHVNHLKKINEGLSNKIGKVVKKLQGKTNPRISVKPGKARLQKQIDRLDFNPRDELHKKIEKFRTDKLNEHLLVAIKDGDKIHVGKPGEIHAEVARRENLIRTHQTHIDGFVPHDDHKHFMDREQALNHVKNNDPKTFSKLKKGIPGLESDSYDDAGGRIRRKY